MGLLLSSEHLEFLPFHIIHHTQAGMICHQSSSRNTLLAVKISYSSTRHGPVNARQQNMCHKFVVVCSAGKDVHCFHHLDHIKNILNKFEVLLEFLLGQVSFPCHLSDKARNLERNFDSPQVTRTVPQTLAAAISSQCSFLFILV